MQVRLFSLSALLKSTSQWLKSFLFSVSGKNQKKKVGKTFELKQKVNSSTTGSSSRGMTKQATARNTFERSSWDTTSTLLFLDL